MDNFRKIRKLNLMSDRDIKKAFEEYRKRHTRSDVIAAITARGFSASFAERAADGKWKATRLQRDTRTAMLDLLGMAS